MGTSVQLTPLAGAYSEGPLCYLLQVDDYRFLLDCGWNDNFDLSLLQPLLSVVSSVDAVLLSHSDTLHLGALPYAVGKLGLTGNIYCTVPVKSMGQLHMYDHYLSRQAVSNFDLFNLDDIDNAFSAPKMVPLKYSQHYLLQGKGQGITITPHAAGRLLGGTIWKITKDTEDIVYAVDFNHRKEHHLNPTVLKTFTRPAVLITDAYNALNSQPARKQRDQEFLDAIMRTIRMDGNVLLPVETAGRVLELLLYLDHHWLQHMGCSIIFLTNVVASTIDSAKLSLEWMSDAISKSFELSRDNAFALKCVKLCTTRREVEELPPGPKVILASMASLEAGFARDIFVEWSQDVRNLVLFTERAQIGTLARQLQVEPPPKFVKVTLSKKIPLTGDELIAYEEEQRRAKEEANAPAINEDNNSTAAVPTSSTAVDDNKLTETSAAAASEAVTEADASKIGGGYRDILIDGFVAPAGTAAPMFPLHEITCEWDEYGEVINPDDYVHKEDYMDFSTARLTADADAKLDAEMENPLAEPPSKVITTDIMLPVTCGLQYMDFEGRADGRSTKNILSHVAPLKLVLIHGSAESTEHLRQHCLKNGCPFVYTPRVGDNVNVTSDLNAYKLRLTERLMSTVLFRKLGEYELAWIDGEVGVEEDDLLPLLPLSTGMTAPPHKAVFVGDVRLADFKRILAARGVQAELFGGVLRCGDNIAVRKSGGQHLVIEGPLCRDYYRIRELLYSQYHIL